MYNKEYKEVILKNIYKMVSSFNVTLTALVWTDIVIRIIVTSGAFK
jgi:hypothetical protein